MLLHCEEGLWYCITIFQIRHGVLESIVINTSWGILYKTRWDGAAAGGGGREREVSVLTMRTKYRVHVEHK